MSRVRRLVPALAVIAIAAVPVACAPIYTAACQGKLVTSTAGPLTDPTLVEISGIHAGVRNPDVWWVHNDSGDTNRIFALDGTGALRGTYTLTGATANDWEDIAIVAGSNAGSGVVYVGDIGDNPGNRAEIQVYRVTEPSVPTSGPAAAAALDAATLRFTYPDGPHDAETLIVDPVRGDLLIVSKDFTGGTVAVYRAPSGLADGSVTQLEKVEDITYPSGLANAVTGGDVSADGAAVVLRTYGYVRVYNRVKNKALWATFRSPPCNAPFPGEGQGEAVTFNPDATSLVTVGEGVDQMIHISSLP